MGAVPLRAPKRRADAIAELQARVSVLEQQLGAVLAALSAAKPRDAADSQLRNALAESTGGRTFTASDLLRHAEEVPELAAALEAADISSPAELGAWLRSQRGTFGGVSVERLRRRCWRVHIGT